MTMRWHKLATVCVVLLAAACSDDVGPVAQARSLPFNTNDSAAPDTSVAMSEDSADAGGFACDNAVAMLQEIVSAGAGCATDADCMIVWGGGCNSLACELAVGDVATAARVTEFVEAYENSDCGCPSGCTPCTCGLAELAQCREGRCELAFELASDDEDAGRP